MILEEIKYCKYSSIFCLFDLLFFESLYVTDARRNPGHKMQLGKKFDMQVIQVIIYDIYIYIYLQIYRNDIVSCIFPSLYPIDNIVFN